MKKLTLILSLFLFSCVEPPKQNPNLYKFESLNYIKDVQTGLCYAYFDIHTTIITCVPCDSLKNVKVINR